MFRKILKFIENKLKRFIRYSFWHNLFMKKKQIKDNLHNFKEEESKEVKKLAAKKMTTKQYLHNAFLIFKDYFIPTDKNENSPKILRPKSLALTAILLLILKVALVGYVYSVYQNEAEMSASITNQVLLLTNESRVANGSGALSTNQYLNQAAQLKAEDMVINGYFSHTSPDGRKPWDFINRNLYPYLLVGENLAMNFITADDVHAALMASPSHRKNILNPKYTDIGIFVISGSIDGQETNVLVEVFAYQNKSLGSQTIVVESSEDNEEIIDEPEQVATDSETQTETVTTTTKTETAEPINEEDNLAENNNSNNNPNFDNQDGLPVRNETSEVLGIEGEARAEETSQEGESNLPKVEKVEEISLENQENLERPSINVKPSPGSSQLVSESDNSDSISTSTVNVEKGDFEQGLEQGLAQNPVKVSLEDSQTRHQAVKAMDISRMIYIALLLVLIVFLLINILVRATVQHKSVIMQSVVLIILILVLIFFDFDFMVKIKNSASNIILF